MKKIINFLTFLTLVLVFTVAVSAKSENAAFKGSAVDPNFGALGEIKYVGNTQGYHFWFTVSSNLGPYVSGHSYHNVYKFDLEDTSDWCGPAIVPNREPYNLIAEVGTNVWFKIFDVTANAYVCGQE
ncbi:hypothetical protein A2954_03250 [Candidatus Roizmanbacteria bacterium RIFCSPLOWO2_01_FULL_37_12]|uniref:Uncharacterized protein n=1 Tax=Candidatus Roizmanbacteria bacterium RIFCSPLOWO2_01_FULL_37_12 TaxID=1802056 RepID=A0A1F7I7Y0_9BACT|nr:MAG: hypothetical protein A2768_00245 [Candidatus Roizmanbacteria bacterium RIFCSPHIGHO2_01_FULL_37_16]OGK39468.1 MAG: hypothetical protein A2954_03250 [Candidatus Roizmanbacteria bacterium RIFCSPLOWO2_01_FULL_37_12]